MRSVPEWIGKTSDSNIPDRVRMRVAERDGWRCQCGCDRDILPWESWDTDHKKALVNGGENRESNLRTLLTEHHRLKTAQDVSEKSKIYRVKKRHRGLRKTSKFACARTSKWKKKINGEVVER